MELTTGGVRLRLPAGWEGAAARPRPPARDPRFGSAASWTDTGPRTLPTLHAATFALPPERGDFGGGAVERMRADDAFVAVVEYGPESAGTPLFAAPALPRRLTPESFDPHALQRTLPGQTGVQAFATERGRPLCLYVVLGHRSRARQALPRVNRLLAGLRVEAAGAPA